MPNISEIAEALILFHQRGGSLQVGARDPESLPSVSVEQTRLAYDELVAAGLMISLHTFAHGRDSRYRLTEAGINHHASRPALLEGSLAPHR